MSVLHHFFFTLPICSDLVKILKSKEHVFKNNDRNKKKEKEPWQKTKKVVEHENDDDTNYSCRAENDP